MNGMNADTQQFESFLTRHFKGTSMKGGLDAKLADLELDSLDLLDLILALERSFGITVDVDAIDQNMTLRELHEMVMAAKP